MKFTFVSFLLVSLTTLLTVPSKSCVEAFGVTQQQQRQQQRQSSSTSTSTSTSLYVVPVDIDLYSSIATTAAAATTTTTTQAAQNLWIATIDSDIANIQLEEFRKVFAGGIAVMAGGLISTTFVGYILKKKDLYTSLAAESYLDMAKDDPDFWKKMSDGLSEEEKAKVESWRIKQQQQQEGGGDAVVNVVDSSSSSISGIINNDNEQEQVVSSSSQGRVETTNADKETAKASNDMFSDY
jgi:hypothetical protein